MILNSDIKDNQDINFNNILNNNKHEYLYENYKIIIDIIDNKLKIAVLNKLEQNLKFEKYEKLYTQEELIDINKIFSMFDKLEDCINIIDINNKNLFIKIIDNSCILTIKLDTKELPKNKISDSIIFIIPIIETQNNNNIINNNINQNNNLNSLNIEQIINKNNNIFLNDNPNQISIYSIIQNLIKKVEQLTEENKEIKNRLNVLEKNNNELINIIKENRINILKERNNLDIPSTNISNNNKNIDNDNFQNNHINNNNNNSDINYLSLFFPQDNFKLNELENEYSSNFLTKIQTKYLKEKTKNKNKLNEKEFKLNKMDIENIQDKNKLNYSFGQNNNNNNNNNNKNIIIKI